jgi:hypothetical protein
MGSAPGFKSALENHWGLSNSHEGVARMKGPILGEHPFTMVLPRPNIALGFVTNSEQGEPRVNKRSPGLPNRIEDTRLTKGPASPKVSRVGRTLLSAAVEVDFLSSGRWWLDFRCQLGVPATQPALAIAVVFADHEKYKSPQPLSS